MSDFAQNFIAGVQAGQSRVKAQQEYEFAKEDRDLKQKLLKHQMDRLKLEDQIHARTLSMEEAKAQKEFSGGMQPNPDTAGQPGSNLPGPPAPDVPVLFKKFQIPGVEALGLPASEVNAPTMEGEQKSVLDRLRAMKDTENAARANQPMTPHEVAALAFQKENANTEHALTKRGQDITKRGQDLAATRAGGTGRKLSDEAINTLAYSAAANGGRVPIGLSRALSKDDIAAVVERTAQLAGSDINKIGAQFKADSATLTQLTKNANAVDAFEATASKNITLLVDLAKKIPDTGAPVLNQPIRYVLTKLGNTDLPAFQKVLNSVNTEIARITNNPNLTGVMAEQARKDAEGAMTGEVSLAQLISSLHAAQLEMKNRKMSFHEQLYKLRNGIDGGLQQEPQTAAPAAAARPRAQSPDGKIIEFDGKSWVPVKQ